MNTTMPSTPVLPAPQGPVSAAVLSALRGNRTAFPTVDRAAPYGKDLQLALYCCYETHYRGFEGVDPAREWDPTLLTVRTELERVFLDALRDDVPTGTDVEDELAELLVEHVDAFGVSHHLRRQGELWQLREYVAHRSLYHLKEADPQTFAIPRLEGPPKAALMTVQHDEYGAGDTERAHSKLYADMMGELSLSQAYGAYLDSAPAEMLAEVNFMSLCGLHRGLRAALIGQFATVELTSSPGSDRLVKAMRRLGCGPAAIRFYAEHVEADAMHEQLVRRKVIAPLLSAEPELAPDVVLGIRASTFLTARFEGRLLHHWNRGESSFHEVAEAGNA
ncbi:iron-containing redox enzyme family protein [Nocardiopsis sp. CNT312]|uniref:iron-containing redox enzyme family protein n=1 Tax=Nocardiopsis sp. CNT312 TaxID=1137268 RepID=UPI00048DB6AE|nr:iron-containing redox enzyme family protein [Nocardiopsis sp. CNT312]